MDYKDICTLKILEKIGNEHTSRQRDMAKSLIKPLLATVISSDKKI